MRRAMGILICGMNGTGKSTLGRVLARGASASDPLTGFLRD